MSGKNTRPPPSLRPPTLMIDLLFGALMLFAFQMGDPSAKQVVPHDFDIPTSDEKASDKPATLFPLKPMIGKNGKWTYQTPDGKRLSPSAVAAAISGRGESPVLLVAKTASVQSYLDAEQPLRRQGLKVGLAIALQGEPKK